MFVPAITCPFSKIQILMFGSRQSSGTLHCFVSIFNLPNNQDTTLVHTRYRLQANPSQLTTHILEQSLYLDLVGARRIELRSTG